jgi:iron-sulfur cluster repair protein YtfE (RIC family)
MTEAYRKTLFDDLSKIISKLEDDIKEKQTILYYLKSEQTKQAEWFISKMVPNHEQKG